MERPAGPRQPENKRNAAFESIFGRPSANHHQSSQIQQLPPQAAYYQQSPYQSYPGYVDRGPTYPASLSSHGESYYRPAYHYQGYSSLPPLGPRAPGPPSVYSRTRSIAGSSSGVPAPLPEPQFDQSLEPLTRAGLTPAQAYQAQVYLNSPQGQQHRHEGLPHIGLDIESSDGNLGLDFGSNGQPGDRQSTSLSSNSSGSGHQTPNRRRDSVISDVISEADIYSSMTGRVMHDRVSQLQTRHRIGSSDGPGVAAKPYPLQVDTTLSNSHAPASSSSPSSSTLVDTMYTTSARRSSESARTMPPHLFRERAVQDRVTSMSNPSTPIPSKATPRSRTPNRQGNRRSSGSARPRRSSPVVYPALLSRVAQAFKERITLGDRVKDGLTYSDAFDGREAVDRIAYIIKTTDRNLALLLGRALDAQKFFHDVTYDHRLRDSSAEIYQFRTQLRSPFVSGELVEDGEERSELPVPMYQSSLAQDDGDPSSPIPTRLETEDMPLPSGVFTLLTDCYSPTCSRDALCYSIACPRRLEQQARLNMKPQPGLKKQVSRESLGDLVEPGTLWIHTVPKEIADSLSDKEKKRQEAINEVVYSERNFVQDMEYLRDSWINVLKDSDIIPVERRTDFLEQVFWNIHDIIAVNTRLRDALNKRQKQYAVVGGISDIFLDAIPHFSPFVSYGAHQLYGKYEFEKEKSSNPAFAQFVEVTERAPESRKLELNGYLTKPTARLARYPLLLEAVIKHTTDDNSDKEGLTKAVALIREFLAKVNVETGRTENRFNLFQLDQQLTFRPGEEVNLRLREEGRELIYKGALNKRVGSGQGGDSGDLIVFLFDHALLIVKQKSKNEQYKVYRRPIPLELLLIYAPDEQATNTLRSKNARHLVKKSSFTKGAPYAPNIAVRPEKGGHSITFVHLGRKHYQITLWANTYVSQRKWVETITKQQEAMRERSSIFDMRVLSEGFFVGMNKVKCAAPFHGGQKVVYGTDDGVYLSDLRDPHRSPVKVLELLDVSQIDFLEEYQLLIVLSERQVIAIPFEAISTTDPNAGLKRAKRISSHTSFFKAGVCLGRTLVCIVKSSPLSSTIKTLEPIDQNVRGRSKPTFKKLLQGGNDTLEPFKEFYIPVESTSIHFFLRTRLCIGCLKGFQIVDLETLDTQGLLDPADESLDFIRKRENIKPMAIYRIDNEFLLCYDEFAFYVNRIGRWSRKDFMIHWEGNPTGFALHFPYVLAFEPTFVEIRHVESGLMSQVIQGNNLRLLFADAPPSTINSSHLSYQQHPNMYNQQGYNSYGSSQTYYNNSYPRPYSRDEIIMVSDDRVLTLRLAADHIEYESSDKVTLASR